MRIAPNDAVTIHRSTLFIVVWLFVMEIHIHTTIQPIPRSHEFIALHSTIIENIFLFSFYFSFYLFFSLSNNHRHPFRNVLNSINFPVSRKFNNSTDYYLWNYTRSISIEWAIIYRHLCVFIMGMLINISISIFIFKIYINRKGILCSLYVRRTYTTWVALLYSLWCSIADNALVYESTINSMLNKYLKL